ncbi:MAG: VCBS repeat-containing protein [Desulfuromonadaceae bacterium]|nr:VCBS repeat-containing protein [Desulfuromonadaceae bacterium]
MKSVAAVLSALLLFLAVSGALCAAPFKTHVAEFNIAGVPNNQELKVTLQGILTSRLNTDLVQLVEKPEQAELLIVGSYAMFGKMFSLDLLIKNRRENRLFKVFEQGEGEEDVIPALGRLAKKIDAELVKISTLAPPVSSTPALPINSNAIPVPPPPFAAPQTAMKNNYVIRPELSANGSHENWSSAPLEGVFSSIAMGRTLTSGERELFVAGERTIRAYLQGKDLKLLAEITIPAPAKILAIDTADLDRNGTPELYVTIMDRESLGSSVYQFDGASLTKIAENLPWFFRGIGNDVNSRTIHVQEMESGGNFYGEVKELVKSDTRFTAENPQKLPRSGNIFNFNRLSLSSGKGFYVVLDEDGHLVISSPDGNEAWKSSDKYGGSETFYKTELPGQARSAGDNYRWTFLEQRITMMKDGTLLLPHNEGTFSVGNIRSFDKYALFAMEWTGAVLKEKWHSRTSPGYLADYAFDEVSREVLLLEVVQKSGMFGKGKSVISINKVD